MKQRAILNYTHLKKIRKRLNFYPTSSPFSFSVWVTPVLKGYFLGSFWYVSGIDKQVVWGSIRKDEWERTTAYYPCKSATCSLFCSSVKYMRDLCAWTCQWLYVDAFCVCLCSCIMVCTVVCARVCTCGPVCAWMYTDQAHAWLSGHEYVHD